MSVYAAKTQRLPGLHGLWIAQSNGFRNLDGGVFFRLDLEDFLNRGLSTWANRRLIAVLGTYDPLNGIDALPAHAHFPRQLTRSEASFRAQSGKIVLYFDLRHRAMILCMQGEAKNEGMSQRTDADSSSLLPSTAIKN